MLTCGIKCEYGMFWVLIFLGEGFDLMLAVEVALVWNPDWVEQEQQLVWELVEVKIERGVVNSTNFG